MTALELIPYLVNEFTQSLEEDDHKVKEMIEINEKIERLQSDMKQCLAVYLPKDSSKEA